MGVVFIILSVIAGVVLLLLLIALILPRNYSVTVSKTINRPKNAVNEYVSLFHNRVQYSEWLKADPNLQPTVIGTDGTVGSMLKWESHNEDKNKNVGMGEQEIKSMDESNIEVELRLLKPMPVTCKLVNRFVEKGMNQTYYTCTFYAYAKFPTNLPSYLVGRRFIIRAQEKTLSNIKTIIERAS